MASNISLASHVLETNILWVILRLWLLRNLRAVWKSAFNHKFIDGEWDESALWERTQTYLLMNRVK